jgi:hypothetical protein
MPEIARHKIHIEGRWELRDLYVFPQRYGEIYSFLYALSAPSPHGRFIEIFQRYPWRGGYSAVNFMTIFIFQFPVISGRGLQVLNMDRPGTLNLARCC